MKAGYQGKDEMRMRAEKAFGNSLKSVTEPTKKSKSHMTLENDKARLYKKGGSVKKCAMGGFQEKGGDPHFRMDGMKKGGKVKKMAMGGVGKIRHKEATKSGMPIKLKKKKVMF